MKLTLGTFFLLTVLSMGTAFVSPTPVAAGEPGGLVACTGATGDNPCDFCDLVTTIDNVIDLLFEILVVVAVIMIVVVGLKLATSGGNVNAMQQSKEMLTNVIIGFVIVLSAWLIVDTVIKIMVGEGSKFGQWNELSTGDCGKSRSDGLYTGPGDGLFCYSTVGVPDTCVYGKSTCETYRNIAAGEGQDVGSCVYKAPPPPNNNPAQENNSPSTNTGNASTDTASADDTSSPRDTAPPPVEESPDLTGTIYEIPCGSAVGCTIFCENGDLSLEAFPRVNSNTGDVQYYRQCQVQ